MLEISYHQLSIEDQGRRHTEWVLHEYPWKIISIGALYRLKKQERYITSYGDREVYGVLRSDSYVRVRESIVREHNIEVHYKGHRMIILRGARADFVKRNSEGEEIAYFAWAGH